MREAREKTYGVGVRLDGALLADVDRDRTLVLLESVDDSILSASRAFWNASSISNVSI